MCKNVLETRFSIYYYYYTIFKLILSQNDTSLLNNFCGIIDQFS